MRAHRSIMNRIDLAGFRAHGARVKLLELPQWFFVWGYTELKGRNRPKVVHGVVRLTEARQCDTSLEGPRVDLWRRFSKGINLEGSYAVWTVEVESCVRSSRWI